MGRVDRHTPPAFVEQAFRKYLECGIVAHVFPRLAVRQWVLSVPKRLRYFLQRDGAELNTALRIFLRVIQGSLHQHCPRANPRRAGHCFGTYQSQSHQTTQSTSASTGERETGDRIGFALG